MQARTGKKLLKTFQVELMSNAYTDGKKFWIPTWSRAPGLRRKIKWSWTLLKRMDLKSGPKSLSIYQAELENNAGRDGTIIWTLRSKRSVGVKKKSGFSTWCIDKVETNGLKSLRFWKEEQTIPSRTTGIQVWRRSSWIWARLWKTT